MVDGEVLVLNYNYMPLNVTSVRRAIAMVYLGKVEVVETDSKVFRSESLVIEMPAVVRLQHYIRRPMPVLRPCRKSIYARDAHTCQYCGESGVPLTLDHVIPKHRGGVTEWENLVTCCTKCNTKKGHRTPDEAGMSLVRTPRRPRYIPYIGYTKFVAALQRPQWRPYLEPYGDGPQA